MIYKDWIRLDTRLALYLDNIGGGSEIKIKVRFTPFHFVFHSTCTIFT